MEEFKSGDLVEFIKEPDPYLSKQRIKHLTFGRKYVVVSTGYQWVRVVNDMGNKYAPYNRSYFKLYKKFKK